MYAYHVTNIIAKIECKPINLDSVLKVRRRLKYDARKFPAVFCKLTSGSCNIFPKSGKVVFLGYKSFNLMNAGANEFLDVFGDIVELVDTVKICSIAATIADQSTAMHLDLRKVYEKAKDRTDIFRNVVYEPELHNALQVFFERPASLVLMLHGSGKGIIAGAKSEADLQFVTDMMNTLELFQT